MKVLNLIQGSAEWLAYRKNGVGSSEIASIAMVPGAYQSKTQVLREKLGFTKQELSDYTARIFADGHEWEAVVRPSVEEAMGITLPPSVVESDDEPRFFASLDGFDSVSGTVLEVKSTSKTELIENLRAGKVFAPWSAQVQWAMMITGAKRALLACVLKDSGEVVVHEVPEDTTLQALLSEVARDFLKELDHARTLAAPARHIDRLEKLKRVAKRAEDRLDLVNAEIKTLAENVLASSKATRLETPSLVIEYQERAGAVDYKKVPELQGIDLDPYRKASSKFIKVTVKKNENKNKELENE